MASVTNSDEKRMATDEEDRPEESHEQKALDDAPPRGAESVGGGFFSIY